MPPSWQPWKVTRKVPSTARACARCTGTVDVDRIEIHDDVAEVLVAMLLARRPLRRAQRDAFAVEGELRLVAIQVVARRRREAHEQRVAAVGDRFDVEGLRFRQRLALRDAELQRASGRGCAEQAADACEGSATCTFRVCGG